MTLYQQWLTAKAKEAEATAERRAIEDLMVKSFEVAEDFEGTKNIEVETFKVKIEGRINRKINSDKLQEIAAENDLLAHLSALFRWKPEINAAVWKSTDPAITTPLLDAITSTPGRPSFTIIKKD